MHRVLKEIGLGEWNLSDEEPADQQGSKLVPESRKVSPKLLTRNGVAVLATFVSPYRERRRKTREEIGDFVEIYVRCPVEVCIERDTKGLYEKALAGEITDFTGVNDPYEEPENPELILNTDKESIEECVRKVLDKLEEIGYISRG